jgi:hypothetical protein
VKVLIIKFIKMLAKGIKGAGAGALVGLAANMGGDILKDSGMTTAGSAVDILGSAASGAMMGSMFGPLGTAIGGALGGAYGLYNNWDNLFPGKTTQVTSTPQPPPSPLNRTSDQNNELNSTATENVPAVPSITPVTDDGSHGYLLQISESLSEAVKLLGFIAANGSSNQVTPLKSARNIPTTTAYLTGRQVTSAT